MDDFAKEVITKMETCEKKRNDNLISMIWQLDFFMVSGYFLALVFSLLAVFMTMSGAGWGASLFGGGCFSLVFGLICHAVITLRRNDK